MIHYIRVRSKWFQNSVAFSFRKKPWVPTIGALKQPLQVWNWHHSPRWTAWRTRELTPLLLLFSWSFFQAGFTGQQHIRWHCDNCIIVIKKKYKLNFVKRKKNTQDWKTIIFRICTRKPAKTREVCSCLLWGGSQNHVAGFTQKVLLWSTTITCPWNNRKLKNKKTKSKTIFLCYVFSSNTCKIKYTG